MKKIIIASINVLSLALIAVFAINCGNISRTLLSQQAAERWAGEREERFAQISCFYPVGGEKAETEIFSFRDGIDKKLSEAGIEETEQGNNWKDAYAAVFDSSAEGERGSSQATVVAVGGDFFLFHPYELLSGSYINEDDLMKDRVVIDRELAWKLYGGTDLEGMSMLVNGKTCYIAGVIARETDKFSQRCFSDKPLIFMHFSALEEAEGAISTYEIAILDPISGFAKGLVTEGIASGDNDAVVENSKRYSFTSILSILGDFGSRSMQTKPLVYPYWENAARLTEDYVALNYAVIALLAIFPLTTLVIIIVMLIKLLIAMLSRAKIRAKDAWEDRYGIKQELKAKRAEKRKNKALKEKRKPGKKPEKPQSEPTGTQGSPDAQDFVSVDGDFLPDIESIVREVLDNEKKL